MSNIVIQNEMFTAEISPVGAELQSLKSKTTGTEYIYDGNSQYWGSRSPVLFPIVGALKDDSYSYNGKTYHMNKHGFARPSTFEVMPQTSEDAVSFKLTHSEKTLEIYPFEFEFVVRFRLVGNCLITDYITENKTDGDMYYSVGAHEGYCIPREQGEAFEDYYLEFECEEDLTIHKMVGLGLFTGKTETLNPCSKILDLKHELFNDDALVFKGVKSRCVSLKSKKTKPVITVDFAGTGNLLIWQKVGAPYICIEPWWGIPDAVDTDGEFSTKPYTMRLRKGERQSIAHTVTISEE